jgi:hypothetical protein
MSKRRFKFTITDAELLKSAYPNAVTITQRTITDVEGNYKVIAALLEAGIEVPGIEIVANNEAPAEK